MVMWFEHLESPTDAMCALVVQIEEYFGREDGKCYVLTIVHEQRIKALTLFHADMNSRWRVMHAN